MLPFLNISSAFGLSGATGLNAYIPLLLVSIMAKFGGLYLAPPYDIMGSWWCIILLAILCIAELVIDKIPGADHVNDIIQTVVRPVAGAILFASQAGVITHVHPAVWLVIGLLMSGTVHVAKSLARPPINLATFGIGASVVSTIENLMATVLSLVAILAPILCLLLMFFFAWIAYKAFQRFRARPILVTAIPITEP
jgi:uncharacterized membrane protein